MPAYYSLEKETQTDLIRFIKHDVKQAERHYFRAGQMLQELKAKQPKGTWTQFIKDNFDFNVRTADRHIASFATALKLEEISIMKAPPTPEEVRAEQRKQREEKSQKRREETLKTQKASREKREAEAEELAKKGKKIVNPERYFKRFIWEGEAPPFEPKPLKSENWLFGMLGGATSEQIPNWNKKFRVLAHVCHPDKGGSDEAMVILNELNDLLKVDKKEVQLSEEEEEAKEKDFQERMKRYQAYQAYEKQFNEWDEKQERDGIGGIIVDID